VKIVGDIPPTWWMKYWVAVPATAKLGEAVGIVFLDMGSGGITLFLYGIGFLRSGTT